MTFYDVTTGTTACGHNHGPNDFIVALNSPQFGTKPGSSPMCGKSITINCGGITATAVIDDQCPGCPPGGLDLTEGLFRHLSGNNMGKGVLSCDWSVGGGGGEAPARTTSSPPPPPPTTHYEPPTTSEKKTSSPPPTTSSSSTSTSTSITSSSVSSAPSTSHQPSSTPSPTQTSSGVNYNNAPASSLAQPTGTVAAGQDQAINSLYQAMIGLGILSL